jgi:hypothetical protein
MNKDKSAVQFDDAFINQGIKTQRFTDASVPLGFQLYGDPNFIGGSGGTSGMNTQWWNFAPRLGFAWDINGDGKTSLRASAGTFYDYPSTFLIQGLTTAGPFAPTIRVNNVNFDNPWARLRVAIHSRQPDRTLTKTLANFSTLLISIRTRRTFRFTSGI